MTRLLVPFSVPDVSAFSKSLKALLEERHAANKPVPSHLELLNLISRAAGLRNFATLKSLSQSAASSIADRPQKTIATRALPTRSTDLSIASAVVRKALLQFDESRRLVRLPNKLSVQRMTMWALWTQFDADRRYTEKEVNAVVNAFHTFGDQATLRRELINMKLLGRQPDCSEYWKEPHAPSDEVHGFIEAWQSGLR